MRCALITLAVVASTAPALATTGGPTEIDVLGYDANDHKIYFVETHHDESGRMPQIYFVHTAGPRIGKITRVDTIQRGLQSASDPDGVLGARVDKLRKRLREVTPLAGFADDDGYGRVSSKLGATLAVTRKRTGTTTALDLDRQPQPCAIVELTLTHGERSGSATLPDCHAPSTGAVSAYAVPDNSATFVVVSSRPDLVEVGYATERPLLLVRTSP